MKEFWTNISRYPRFFISSLIGLILIIITPLRSLFKVKRFRFFSITVFLFLLSLLFIILKSMVSL